MTSLHRTQRLIEEIEMAVAMSDFSGHELRGLEVRQWDGLGELHIALTFKDPRQGIGATEGS